jgi:outer membrane protein assembly factor BamB
MRIVYGIAAAFAAIPLAIVISAQAPTADRYWPQWRGPLANGISRTANPPIEWGEGKNVRWKVEIPGRGSASPVIWGDRVFGLCIPPRPA